MGTARARDLVQVIDQHIVPLVKEQQDSLLGLSVDGRGTHGREVLKVVVLPRDR